MNEYQKIIESAGKLTPFNLPIGVYLVTKDGRFVECNRRAREMFKLPLKDLANTSIADLYLDRNLREELTSKVEEAEREGKWLEKQSITLKIGPSEIVVQDYTRSIRDPETNEIIGYICCVIDITEEEQYRQQFELLPIGVYKLDADDKIINANLAVTRMLGLASPSELEGKSVKDFNINPKEVDRLREMIEENGSVVKQTVELLKSNGETIFASVSARKVTSPDGRYAGREGTIIDVTTEERDRRIMEDVPVGLYMLRLENGEDIVRHCNQQFADINEFENMDECMGFKMKELHSSHEEYKRFIDALEEQSKLSRSLDGYQLEVKTRKGNIKTFEVNSRILRDIDDNIIGRAGSVRDITEEADLKSRVRELTADIGNVLHAYTQTLLTVQHSVSPAIELLGPDHFDEERRLLPEEAVAALSKPADSLIRSLDKFLALSQSGDRSEGLLGKRWNELSRLLGLLREFERTVPGLEYRPPTLREIAVKILGICAEITRGKFPRELLRQINVEAYELARICNLISLHQARHAIVEMDHLVRGLREYVTSGARTKEPTQVCWVSALLQQAVDMLDNFAKSRGVHFKITIETDCLVEVIERDLVRALTNLLHNAIKYSWSRPVGEPPWITIRVRTVQSQVHVDFTNYGVPIPKEEIEKKLIFQICFRGRLSSDRGRLGTGIGLTDARRVARRHNGDVIIESRPSHPGGKDDDYKQPFLTTAILKLPVHSEHGEEHEA